MLGGSFIFEKNLKAYCTEWTISVKNTLIPILKFLKGYIGLESKTKHSRVCQMCCSESLFEQFNVL